MTSEDKITETILTTGSYLKIYPPTKHWLESLDEDVILIEYRITHFEENRPDTYTC